MKILLDIDGVMVPGATFRKTVPLHDGFSKFTDKSVNALNQIIDATGATIVLTTSHKHLYSIDRWKQIFKTRGINISSLSRLPLNSARLNRRDEVSNWLSGEEIEDEFIIIDDDKSLNALPKKIKQHLILTRAMVGLNESYVSSAVNSFKAENLAY